MKLWRCDDCGGYYNKAWLVVPMSATCQLKEDRVLFADPDFEPKESWKLDELDLSGAECPECDGQLEIVEVDACPHDWRMESGSVGVRICRFCGKRQRGVITWPGS